MSCEQAKAEVEQAWAQWKTALDKLASLVNPFVVNSVDEAGAQAIDEASQEFAAANQRFLGAVRSHLTASASHRPGP